MKSINEIKQDNYWKRKIDRKFAIILGLWVLDKLIMLLMLRCF